MASETSEPVSGTIVTPESGLATLSPQGMATLDAIMGTVPDSDTGGIENILDAITAATSVDQLDAPWQSAKAEQLIGVPLSIQTVSKSPSEFEGGTGWFLIVRAAIRSTGEAVTFMTSAGAVVLQLAQACALEAANPGKVFPFVAVIRAAGKPQPGRSQALRLEIVR